MKYFFYCICIAFIACAGCKKKSNPGGEPNPPDTGGDTTIIEEKAPVYTLRFQVDPLPDKFRVANHGYLFTSFVGKDYALRLTGTETRDSIYRFSDGKWENIYIGYGTRGYALLMLDENNGYYSSRKGIADSLYKTQDGGLTWEAVNFFNYPINQIAAPSQNVLYFTTSLQLYKTTDGGETITTASDYSRRNYITKTFFVDENVGYAGYTDGLAMKTENGGDKWEEMDVAVEGDVHDIFFADEKHGYITSTTDSLLYVTGNGGRTWDTRGPKVFRKAKVFFYPDGRGLIVENTKRVYYTTDFGKHTTFLFSPAEVNYNSKVVKIDDNTLMVLFDYQLYQVDFEG